MNDKMRSVCNGRVCLLLFVNYRGAREKCGNVGMDVPHPPGGHASRQEHPPQESQRKGSDLLTFPFQSKCKVSGIHQQSCESVFVEMNKKERRDFALNSLGTTHIHEGD